VPSENTEQRKLAAIMFTDMVGYSALSQRNEALALELLEEHRGVLRGMFPKHQGAEIKTTGDGFLVEFASALAAVRCAVEIQRALAERNHVQPAERQVRIRIGIHLGDVVRSAGDVHGDGEQMLREWDDRVKQRYISPGLGCFSILDLAKRTRPSIGWRKVMRSRMDFIAALRSIRVSTPCEPSRASRRC